MLRRTLKGAWDQRNPPSRRRDKRNGVVAKDLDRGEGPTLTCRAAGVLGSSHLGAPIGAGWQVLTVLLIATP